MSRDTYLLMVAHNILKKCDDSPFILNVLEVTEDYDGTECDGCCLMEDIEMQLSFEHNIELNDDGYYNIPRTERENVEEEG